MNKNSKVEKKSSELKMNYDGILEENHFSRSVVGYVYFLLNFFLKCVQTDE